MTSPHAAANRVRLLRLAAGLTQAELAARAGISRTAVTAIEQGRLTTSVSSALALAQVLGCTVEDLFGPTHSREAAPAWVAPPPAECRYWRARVGSADWLYPVEPTNAGEIAHDGVWSRGALREARPSRPDDVLVVATCDPAVALLAAEYARAGRFRLLPLTRSSRAALQLVHDRRAHVAGVHLSATSDSRGNAAAVRAAHGAGFRKLRIGTWQEGLALGRELRVRSTAAAVRSQLKWVGREPGSGARQCLDELLAGKRPPRHVAHDHRGVALAIRSGWADAGVCLKLAAEEAGLGFLPIRSEAYDLCFREEDEDDPRIRSLIDVARSSEYRRLLDALPGYQTRDTGDVSAC